MARTIDRNVDREKNNYTILSPSWVKENVPVIWMKANKCDYNNLPVYVTGQQSYNGIYLIIYIS